MALSADALRSRVPAARRTGRNTTLLAAGCCEPGKPADLTGCCEPVPRRASAQTSAQAGGPNPAPADEYQNLLSQLHWLLLNLTPAQALAGTPGQTPTPPIWAPVPPGTPTTRPPEPKPEPKPEEGQKPAPKPEEGQKPQPKPEPEPKPEPKPAPKPEPKPEPAPAPAPAPAPVERQGSGPLLRRGSTGPAVEALQRRLAELGFNPGPIDGDFGPKTQAAVKAFQARERIEVDGIVGPQTWKHLGITVDRPGPPDNVGSPDALRNVTQPQLAAWGANNKDAFFAALKPAAVEAERKYGVPWQITLAQAALESGWGKHAIGGYNIFGIKGTGPAGSVSVPTQEYVNGRYITITAKFARYHDFYEGIVEHGKLFHNGYYDKAVNQFAKDRDPVAFARNIHGIYATSPVYADSLISIMKQYGLI